MAIVKESDDKEEDPRLRRYFTKNDSEDESLLSRWRRYMKTVKPQRTLTPLKLTPNQTIILVFGVLLWHLYYSGSVPDLKEKEMVIGVLSARDHFDHRLAIRFTWSKFFPDSKYKFVFILGDRDCGIHPDNRVSPYGCEEKTFPSEELRDEFRITEITQGDITRSQGMLSFAFGLRVHHPVILKALGLLNPFVEEGSVVLRDAAGKIYLYYRFSWNYHKYGAYSYETNGDMLLPKGFEGEIVFIPNDKEIIHELHKPVWSSSLGHNAQCSWFQTERLEYTFIETTSGIMEWMPDACSIVTAIFEPANEEVESLEVIRSRQEEWKKIITTNKEKLQTEMEEFGNKKDMLFLPIQDTYNSLPYKVMEFMKWSTVNYKFKYLLKLDDDSFVDKKNLTELLSENSHEDVAWWSFFKKGRAVQRFGKWADFKYPSPMLIDFPAGSGYLMTYKMVNRLVSASEHLQYYQGEDVNIGLWAAAVAGPIQHHIMCWLPNPHCPHGSVIMEQKEPYELFKLWKDNSEKFSKIVSEE
ncbi:UDP-GalNAc:beta-1,3-N-acetylgalactosaminyltransferase 2-like [Oratosquilla oratoria]|uniref:UDP-GalNAc:beta-1, 3-N-acetylgalactosaminyltransferase 2-like n=1 Tax=Oratosquilla oratoria TaxID=337810 RepID=UPI003F75CF88